jgi:hypothetical protein
MKKAIEKLSKSTVAKFLAAAIVPGGFIVWGLYEYSKFRRTKKSPDSGAPKEDKSRPHILDDIKIDVDDA